MSVLGKTVAAVRQRRAARAPAVENKTPVPFTGPAGVFGTSSDDSGKADPVYEMRAFGSVGTLFAIVNLTSESTSAVEWKLWRKSATGKKEDRVQVTTHAALTVWDNPNNFYSGQELRESGQQHVDLTGEGWLVVGRDPRFPTIPLELWVVRPDRISPVKSPTDFLTGYVYKGPGGELIPLPASDVMQIRMPNPLDPWRGIGAVQSVLTSLDSDRYSAEWNRNFFLNSAEPGGIIEVPEVLGDEEFKRMVMRWRQQHQGVAQAHRVGILENAKWVDRRFSMRDMQFTELRNVNKDDIREAFRIPKFALGIIEDVNRASAIASATWFAQYLTVPRLERWKSLLNKDFLPLFGATAVGLEFDYENPIPADAETDREDLTAHVNAVEKLIKLGFDPDEACDAVGLPRMKFEKPAPPPQLAPPGAEPDDDESAPDAKALNRAMMAAIMAQSNRLLELTEAGHGAHARDRSPFGASLPDIDLDGVQEDWEAQLGALMDTWAEVTGRQTDEIIEQVRAAVNNHDPQALSMVIVTTSAATQFLAESMIRLAEKASGRVVDEAKDQGVTISDAAVADAGTLLALAAVTAALLGQSLANAGAREALRRYAPGASGDAVAGAVRAHLDALSPAYLEAQLGGALTSAQNEGRIATMLAGPVASLYASEVMDKRTCGPCSRVNGKFLGVTDDISTPARIDQVYPNGGYAECEGGVRCRGTVVAVWRPETVGGTVTE